MYGVVRVKETSVFLQLKARVYIILVTDNSWTKTLFLHILPIQYTGLLLLYLVKLIISIILAKGVDPN